MTSPATGIATIQPARRRLRIARRPPDSIRPAMPRPERRDGHGRLITALLAAGGADCTLVSASIRPWCSATFIGAQHRLTLRLACPESLDRAQALADRLGEAELAIPGHIVADLAVDAIRQDEADAATIELAVLTIEDW